jgi:DNA-directed RNA polymerase subunit RPC12/RpoP
MARMTINCRKCGKEIRLDLSNSEALCKRCRKNKLILKHNTTQNFDF